MLVQKGYSQSKDMAMGRILISDSWMNHWGLVNLLQYFENKCCAIRRDVVYSVLSLSWQFEALKVNYQSPASEVVWQLMSICQTLTAFARWQSLYEHWAKIHSLAQNLALGT